MTQHYGCQQRGLRGRFFWGEENEAVHDMEGNPAHRKKYDDIGQAFGPPNLSLPLPDLVSFVLGNHRRTGHRTPLLLADDVDNVQVNDQHEDERRDDDAEEDKVYHVLHVDDFDEGARLKPFLSQVPPHDWDETEESGHDPGDQNHHHGSLHRHQTLVAEWVADGQEPLQGYGQQIKNRDVGDEHHQTVQENAAIKVHGQSPVRQEHGRRDDDAHEDVGSRQTADEAVGDGVKVGSFPDS